MSKELQADIGLSAQNVYFVLRDSTGRAINGTTPEAYLTANLSSYAIAATEQGTASGYYAADMPDVTAGVYSFVGKVRAGGSPAESDLTYWSGEIKWTAAGVVPEVTVPPSDTDFTTGYLIAYDETGVAESGVEINCIPTSPGAVHGASLDNATRTETSDGDGLVSFTNLIKGATYKFWRGTGEVSRFVAIPTTAGDTYALPAVIGTP